MKKTILTIATFCTYGFFAFAQEETESKDSGKFSVSGYVDSYYLTAFNRPRSGVLTGLAAGRAFDRLTDQFALGLAQTRFAYTNDKSEMVIDLTFGPNAQLGNFGNAGLGYVPSDPAKAALMGTGAAIKQAYFTYNLTEKLSFTVGQFGTHIGYEVIDAPVNFHYSLSHLFNNGPFYHIGGKLNYTVSDKIGVMVGLVNNWDAMIDWKSNKSLVAQLSLAPMDGLSVYLNAIGGSNDDGYLINTNPKETGTAPAPYTRMLYDLTAGYQINDNFYFGVNAAYGMYMFNTKGLGYPNDNLVFADATESKSAGWYGVALYPNYKINDMLSIGLRYEYFNDKKGVRYFGGDAGVSAVNNAVTLTMPITLAEGHVIIKPEFRLDATSAYVYTSPSSKTEVKYYENKDGFETLDTSTGNLIGGSKSQSTIGVAFIYKY